MLKMAVSLPAGMPCGTVSAAAEASRAAVEGGERQRLQRRFAGELWQARVGHAVADDQYILHPESLPFLSIADRVTRPR